MRPLEVQVLSYLEIRRIVFLEGLKSSACTSLSGEPWFSLILLAPGAKEAMLSWQPAVLIWPFRIFCVCIRISFLSSEWLRTCARQPCADVALTPALTQPPTFLPSFLGELANKSWPRRLRCAGPLGKWMGENIWMPDRCLISRFLVYFTSLRTNSS